MFIWVTLLTLLQRIPTQLQWLIPTYDDKRDWLWLSRLAFHVKKATTSVFGVGEEAKAAKWEEETSTRMMRKINRTGKERNCLEGDIAKDVIVGKETGPRCRILFLGGRSFKFQEETVDQRGYRRLGVVERGSGLWRDVVLVGFEEKKVGGEGMTNGTIWGIEDLVQLMADLGGYLVGFLRGPQSKGPSTLGPSTKVNGLSSPQLNLGPCSNSSIAQVFGSLRDGVGSQWQINGTGGLLGGGMVSRSSLKEHRLPTRNLVGVQLAMKDRVVQLPSNEQMADKLDRGVAHASSSTPRSPLDQLVAEDLLSGGLVNTAMEAVGHDSISTLLGGDIVGDELPISGEEARPKVLMAMRWETMGAVDPDVLTFVHFVKDLLS
ncbi:hypothetical protein TEA_021565 [Camellia sinensis var. sinensis]|uniref:Uncharacterized protein n=1 Tax=Camellia sinensis var. sinensis TaxID=542762 RepID=A0A4S4EU09_CAMSN|nr:hypothetical protein TEA_021565 [Camellia sinensis var. sinensis]